MISSEKITISRHNMESKDTDTSLREKLYESNAKIGELERANTFLKFKLRYQLAESDRAAKRYQAKIARLQEEIAKLSTKSSSTPTSAIMSPEGSDPVHMQRWPEVLQNPNNANKLSPKQLLAIPRSTITKHHRASAHEHDHHSTPAHTDASIDHNGPVETAVTKEVHEDSY